MKRKILLLLILLPFSVLKSQVKLKGQIVDGTNNSPIALATISLSYVSDSSLLSYTISDKRGNFNFENIPPSAKLKVIIACASYKTNAITLISEKKGIIDLGNIKLSIDTALLNEVTVTANIAPVIIRNDTIEFNTAQFKLKSYAVLEDLLKKLPGIQINKNGDISMNGKPVNRIYIDGKNFFGNNTQIASKNLSADIVEKVQITDDRENDPDHIENPNNLSKVINIKLKKSIKSSIFGKVYAGYGSNDKYQLGGLVNSLQDTLQVSILGSSNNLNKTGFSFNELRVMGILERGGFDNASGSNNGFSVNDVSFGGGANGIETATGTGININNDWGKTLSLNSQYFYAKSTNLTNSLQNIRQFTADSTYVLNNQAYSRNVQEINSLGGTLKWQPNPQIRLRYTPGYTFNVVNNYQAKDNQTYILNSLPINSSNNITTSNNKANKFQQSFQFYIRSKDAKKSLTFNHSLQISTTPNQINSNLYTNSLYPTFNIDSVFLLRMENNKKTLIANEAIFRQKYSNTFSVYSSIAITNNSETMMVDTKQADSVNGKIYTPVPDQTNFAHRIQNKAKLKGGFSIKNKKNIRFDLDLSLQDINVKNEFAISNLSFNKSYFNLIPSAVITMNNTSISYNYDLTLPSLSYIQPAANKLTPYYTFIGNPELKPTYTHVFNISYYDANYKTNWDNFAYLKTSYSQNGIVLSKTIQADGSEINTPINTNGLYSITGSYGFNKSFRKKKTFKWSYKNSFIANYSQSTTYANNKTGRQSFYRLGITPGGSFNIKDWLEFGQYYSIYTNLYRYDISGTNNNFTTTGINSSVSLKFSQKTGLDLEDIYTYNSNIPQGLQRSINQVNLALFYQPFEKNKSQIRLSVYDLLDQNVNIFSSVTSNSVSFSQTEIIKRYIMLSYIWNFKSIKSIRKPIIEQK